MSGTSIISWAHTVNEGYNTLTKSEVMAARHAVTSARPRPLGSPPPERPGSWGLSADGRRLPTGPLLAWLARVHPGLSDVRVCAVLGIDRTAIGQWRRHPERRIPAMRGDEFAGTLGVHPSEIWGDEWFAVSECGEDAEKRDQHLINERRAARGARPAVLSGR